MKGNSSGIRIVSDSSVVWIQIALAMTMSSVPARPPTVHPAMRKPLVVGCDAKRSAS